MPFNQYFHLIIPSSVNTSVNKSDVILETLKTEIDESILSKVYLGFVLTQGSAPISLTETKEVLNNSPESYFEIQVDLKCNVGLTIIKGQVKDSLDFIIKLIENHNDHSVTIGKFVLQLPNTRGIKLSSSKENIKELLQQVNERIQNGSYHYILDSKTGALFQPNSLNLSIALISKFALNPYANGLDGDDEVINNYLLPINPSHGSMNTSIEALFNQLDKLHDTLLTLSVSLISDTKIVFNRLTPKGIKNSISLLVDKELIKPNNFELNFVLTSNDINYDFQTKERALRGLNTLIESSLTELLSLEDEEIFSQKNYISSLTKETIEGSFKPLSNLIHLAETSIPHKINVLLNIAYNEQLNAVK